MPIEILLSLYCVFVIAASVSGGRLPQLVRMTHLRTQIMMSFVGGLMLGIALLHLLPHAANYLASPHKIGVGTLLGVMTMFLLQRAFAHHHHEVPAEDDETAPDHHFIGDENPDGDGDGASHDHVHHQTATKRVSAEHDSHTHSHDEHSHTHATPQDHEHETTVGCEHEHHAKPTFGWVGMVFGLGLHTMIDGVAIAASAMAEHGAWLGLAGLGTFLAVALHKPLDAFAITTMMRAEGWSQERRSLVNVAFSISAPVGALLFYFGASQFEATGPLIGWGLAISAGFFLCIALADLLPELSFHDHDRGKLTAALFVGIVLAIAVESLPGHSHSVHSSRESLMEIPGEIRSDQVSLEDRD